MEKNRMYRVSDYKEGYNALDDIKTVGKELKRLFKGQTKEEAEEEERQKKMAKKKVAQQKVAEKYGDKYEVETKYDIGDKVILKKKNGNTVEGEVTDAWLDEDTKEVMYEVECDGGKTVEVPEKAIIPSPKYEVGDKVTLKKVKEEGGENVEAEVTKVMYDEPSNSIRYEVEWEGGKKSDIPERAIVDSAASRVSDSDSEKSMVWSNSEIKAFAVDCLEAQYTADGLMGRTPWGDVLYELDSTRTILTLFGISYEVAEDITNYVNDVADDVYYCDLNQGRGEVEVWLV